MGPALRAAALLALVATAPAAQTRAAGGLDLLRLPAGAGPAALGEAVTAVRGGLDGLPYNPAAIAGTSALSLGFSLLDAPGLFESRFAALGAPLGDRTVMAGFGRVVTFDPIVAADANGAPLGEFAPHAAVFGATVSRALGPALDVGVSAKWLALELAPAGLARQAGLGGEASATGWAVDLGAAFRATPTSPLRLGAALLDLGPSLRLGSAADPLPTRLRVGAALDLAAAARGRAPPLRGTVVLDREEELAGRGAGGALHAGAELRFLDLIALRGGIASAQAGDDGMRRVVGIGVLHPHARLEFAYELSGSPALDNQTHVSVGIRF